MKNIEDLFLMTLEIDAKFEEKLALDFKNDMKNLVNSNASGGKSENLHFDMVLLSIAYKVSAKKGQNINLSWHWRVIQTLKKNDMIHLMKNLKNLKICTLMGYFCHKYVMFGLKLYRRFVSWKKTYGLRNDIRNLVRFTQVVESNVG